VGNLVYRAKLTSTEFQVILMGHGIGGLSVIHAMHEFVDRVKQAIFVAAAMLPFGLQTDEDKKDVMFPDFSFFCPQAYATYQVLTKSST
jgi:predicted alpha/beta hydrolase family esterase